MLGVVTLDADESDFPWLVGRLEPSPAYAAVKPLFDEMDRQLESLVSEAEADRLHDQVMGPGIHMKSLADGESSEVAGIPHRHDSLDEVADHVGLREGVAEDVLPKEAAAVPLLVRVHSEVDLPGQVHSDEVLRTMSRGVLAEKGGCK
jgi:hypothetical protein